MNIQTCPDPVARACELGAEIAAAADEIERTRCIPAALRTHEFAMSAVPLKAALGTDMH